jgi:DNA-binding winged helix-turn-helix (wHTH) protein
MRYRFGAFELDPAGYSLFRDGREVETRPKMFDLLLYLIEHRERVVSTKELLEAIWPNEHVAAASVAWTMSHLRHALGQRRGQREPLDTIRGRGYRFRSAVEVIAPAPPPASRAEPPRAEPPRAEPLPVPIAVPMVARPFVGRGELMRRLEALLQGTSAGHGGLCLLHGEAGIGKTRCVEELARIAQSAGLSVLSGRAVEDAFAPVFWPWIQILRAAIRTRPELREAAEPLLTRLTALEEASAAGDDGRVRADRFWLLDDVTRFLLKAAMEAHVVLLIDDLQWADTGTLDLLKLLSTELSTARMLVVATARVSAAGELEPRLADAARRAERIELTRLSPEQIGHYIVELTAMQSAPPSLVRALHQMTAGNPLFVQEALRTLLAEHGKDALGTLTETELLPRGVLEARLASLSVAERSLLSCASVLGDELDLSLLQAVSGLPLSEVLDLIESAKHSGLVVAETPQRCGFSHGLFRHLLYEELGPAERIALHRSAAESLEALRAVEPRYSEIAHHYYRSLPAGGFERVTAAARRAASAAETVFAFEDAVRFYGWALEAQALDDAIEPRQRAELLLAAGSAERLAGRGDDARKTLGRMFEIARRQHFTDLVVRGVRALRPTPAMGSLPDPQVRAALEDVLKAGAASGEPSIRALAQLSCVPPYATDLTRSKQMSGKALEQARSTGGRSLLLEVLCARFYSLSGPDDTDALLSTAAEVLELDDGRPTPSSVEAHCARAGALIYRGEIAAADQAFEVVARMSSELRLREGLWYCQRQAAQRRFLEGRFDVAEAACAELRSQGERFGLYYSRWFTSVLARSIAVERRRSEAVTAAYDFSLFTRPLADAHASVHLNVKAQTTRAAAELGRMEVARLGVDALATIGFDTFPKDIAYLNNLASVAVAVVALADRPRAEQLYALLAPYPHHNTPEPTLLYEGSVSRYLALLAACLGHRVECEAHFEDALTMNRRIGQQAMVARTCFEYARWLAGQRRGAARAKELSLQAAKLSESLGMAWLGERARALVG